MNEEVEALEQDAEETQETVQDQPSVEEAVLEEMGLSEPEETPAEEEPKQGKPEPVAQPEKGITDDDLAPLNSKNQATNERFHKITEGYKQKTQEVEELSNRVKQYEQSFEVLQKMGFNDESAARDLMQFADYRRVIATGDVDSFKKMVADQVRMFEAAHGKKVSIQASALDYFDDLRNKVENLDIDEGTALELAQKRAIEARISRERQSHAQQRQMQYQQEQALNQAVSQVEQLQANWAKTDPDYQAVLPYLQAKMEEVGKSFPPHQWANVISLQYQSLKDALAAQNRQRDITTPLRGNSRATGRVAPSNPVEAVLQEFGFDD